MLATSGLDDDVKVWCPNSLPNYHDEPQLWDLTNVCSIVGPSQFESVEMMIAFAFLFFRRLKLINEREKRSVAESRTLSTAKCCGSCGDTSGALKGDEEYAYIYIYLFF